MISLSFVSPADAQETVPTPEGGDGATSPAGLLDAVLSPLAAAWNWWQSLFAMYAWQEIGAYLVPALIVLVVVIFWSITRMHLND
ncbi:MAG: hypothetical protein ACTS3R_20435 [Inquilinaceae bacterium]